MASAAIDGFTLKSIRLIGILRLLATGGESQRGVGGERARRQEGSGGGGSQGGRGVEGAGQGEGWGGGARVRSRGVKGKGEQERSGVGSCPVDDKPPMIAGLQLKL